MSIMVWEWQNESNIFLPYTSEVSASLERARNNDIKQLDLGSVDPFLSTFTVDIPMMTQITNYNGKRRVVRRVNINPTHPFARGERWEWNFHLDHWFPYSTEVSAAIQLAVDTNIPSIRNVLPGYQIDVRNLIQTNVRTNFQRKIRKIPCTKYKVAVVRPTPNSFVSSTTQPATQSPQLPPMQHFNTAMQSVRQQSARQPVPQQSPRPALKLAPQQVAPPITSQPAAQPSSSSRPPANKHRPPRPQPSSSSNPITPSSSNSSNEPGLPAALQSIIQSSCTQYTIKPGSSDQCPVCFNDMTQPSDYTTSPQLIGVNFPALTLSCGHHIHAQCLHRLIMAAKQTSSFQCPECQKSYGQRTGTQPASGKMGVKVDNSISLAGYEQYGTIIVTYSFTSGVQDGVAYSASNFPRTAYFPDTDEGNDVVDLIKVAFKRRLIFTIGDSVTTGQKNCVVWNDIHHKTSMRRGDTYGYPDPGYLARVTAELKSKGVE